MKKVLCILLAAILTLSLGVTAFAATPALGDPDGDGYVTSADARLALRVSAKLDSIDSDTVYSVDVNKDGIVSAADARTILRMSAMIYEASVPVRTSLDYDRSDSSTKLNISFSGLCNGQESFYVTVSAENIAGLQNANLLMEYDADLIECVNVQQANSLSISLFAGECISEGKIALAWLYTTSTINTSEDIAVIEFSVKKDGNANFKCNVGTWDGTAAPADVNIQQTVSVNGVQHVNTTEYDEYIEDGEFYSCYKTYYSAGVYCNDCHRWISGHESTQIVEHLDLVEVKGSLEYFDDSCIMIGYTDGVHCDNCYAWVSGHEQTMKIVHIDSNNDRVCDYCDAYIRIPDIPETDEEESDNENSDNENVGMFDSIIAFLKKFFEFLKQLFGV